MNYSLENIIECLLLVSDEPLTINQILKILDDKKISKEKLNPALIISMKGMLIVLSISNMSLAVIGFKLRQG